MNKVMACYVLHYGAEWLRWSMRSVAPCVDIIGLFYTSAPSFGHSTILKCPETADDLVREAQMAMAETDTPVRWFDAPTRFRHEGEHRTWAVNKCFEMADMVLVVDADEIWRKDVLEKALHDATVDNDATDYLIGMRHFWRSVKWVCDDPAMPNRIIKPGAKRSIAYLGGKVYHMGYAQSPELIHYKQDIHGHKGEWRDDWYANRFISWHPGDADVHPTNENFWTPVPYEDDGLYDLIKDHPYMNLDIIWRA